MPMIRFRNCNPLPERDDWFQTKAIRIEVCSNISGSNEPILTFSKILTVNFPARHF